jgi:hypothetical protein
MDTWMWGAIGAFRKDKTLLFEAADLEAAYLKWVEDVKATVPSDKLLVHTAADGYAPICAFLGIEVCPTEPYPHLNDGTQLAAVGMMVSPA